MDTVVPAETGTVTTGRMPLLDVVPAPGAHQEVLGIAGAFKDAWYRRGDR